MDMDKKNMLECVAKAACMAYMKGFVVGSSGSVSIRIQGQMYVPPSRGCLGDLMTEGMTMLEADGLVPSAGGPDYGGRRPSKEAGVYLACYGSRPDTLRLFRLRSPYPIVVACRRQEDRGPAMEMPAYTPGYAIRVGRTPMVPYCRPGSRELAEAVSGVICRRDSLLLANHGMVAAGKSLEVVPAVMKEIEENAHLAIFLGDQGAFPDEE